MKKQSTTIASIIILIIIAIFALLNTATVVVNLFGARVKTPLVLLIFICLLIGAMTIYLLSFSSHLKTTKELKELQSSRISKDELKRYQKKINQLQKENSQLKQQIKQEDSQKAASPVK
ncbi:LapA family protein [Limosilactobacillus sp. RRLNB_1_1]|uniref:LapA family protein n=1 Tax=Limosilactobacillus albertensis TaxID=2759752 RepID=A0A7W3Y840_9LACO|nr:LapA family protein [Limosilactobacillus albertensis]MBB1069610.1 LapA family protein [Limosilactobacillus albertensis]MCD7118191.1 LapA family protein [Limosilactobacillus albertensis]MCD7128005.1 LapA family protein [Limosilactobacillus albertensis]